MTRSRAESTLSMIKYADDDDDDDMVAVDFLRWLSCRRLLGAAVGRQGLCVCVWKRKRVKRN